MIPQMLKRHLDRTAYVGRQLSLLAPLVLFHRAIELLVDRGLDLPDGVASRAIRERYEAMLRRDLANVEEGLYPRQLLFQMPLGAYARALPWLLPEIARMGLRRATKRWRDLPDGVDVTRYPAYFRQNFHWQSDGYLSRRSAELYDLGVEILFLGMADVMRRQVIPPLTRFLAVRPGQELRVLDVACGTGRTLLQIAIAHPGLRLVGLDLSPYYLQFARSLLAKVSDVSLLADNAEQLPFVDAHFDVVTSVYLFHELPHATRRRVLAEAYRVLAPGGLLILEDSGQHTESPQLDHFARWFQRHFHEPYIEDYYADDLALAASEAGFDVQSVEPCFVSKIVVARR
jgi:ubiquinone/menaquinone biosynthesis C-methylase UbiE